MSRLAKKMKARWDKVPENEQLPVEEAFQTLKMACTEIPRKFDETVEAYFKLGIDPKKAEQQIRGTIVLPSGTGKVPRIVVFAAGDKFTEAEQAGVEFAGGDDLAEKILGGWLDFDVAISTPDMMRIVGKLGKVLGPRGLMPNPKSGTVTFNIKETIDEFKKGKVEYRNDKFGIIAVPIGKVSFEPAALLENFSALYNAVVRARPSSAKGQYIKSVYVSATMGPSVKIDISSMIK
ncbi:MAG TPA: 50S ribosomal protein L1 [bacterium]|nr:50S ribosomal protein L1 [bacterium]